MATSYQSATDPSMDPGMTDPGAGPDDDTNGFTVCITVSADGQYTVGEQGEQMSPASDIKDALTQAMQLLKSGGAADEKNAQDSFDAGYSKPMPMKSNAMRGGY